MNLLHLMLQHRIRVYELPLNFLLGPCDFSDKCRKKGRGCKFRHDDLEERVGQTLNSMRVIALFLLFFLFILFFIFLCPRFFFTQTAATDRYLAYLFVQRFCEKQFLPNFVQFLPFFSKKFAKKQKPYKIWQTFFFRKNRTNLTAVYIFFF